MTNEPPEFLDAFGKRKWREIIALMPAIDLAAMADRAAMAAYCEWYSIWRKANAKKPEILIEAEPYCYESPCHAVRNLATDEMMKLSRVLGLDPASRARM